MVEIQDTYSHDELRQLLSSKGSDSSGCSAKFYRINDTWGFKTYNNDESRDYHYDTQAAAAEFGLGPKVGGMFNIPLPSGEVEYGYVTEIADTSEADEWDEIADYCGYSLFMPLEGKCPDEFVEHFGDEGMQKLDEMTELTNELYNNVGFDFHDCHGGNFGRLKTGELVCIDFG